MSIIHDVEQGSGDWFALRVGIPTASEFHKILTPKKLELSEQRKKYSYRLVAERLLNRPMECVEGTEWMENGKAMEHFAVKAYSMMDDVETKKVGFITTNNKRIGASPDRLIVGKNAGLEIKCPSPQVQVQYLADDFGDEYRLQVQGQNWVGEFDYSIKYAWHQEFPAVRVFTPRDEAVIKKLAAALDQFCDETDELHHRLKNMGYFQQFVKTPTPAELEFGNLLSAG